MQPNNPSNQQNGASTTNSVGGHPSPSKHVLTDHPCRPLSFCFWVNGQSVTQQPRNLTSHLACSSCGLTFWWTIILFASFIILTTDCRQALSSLHTTFFNKTSKRNSPFAFNIPTISAGLLNQLESAEFQSNLPAPRAWHPQSRPSRIFGDRQLLPPAILTGLISPP